LAILRALFETQKEVDRLRAQNRELQAAHADVRQQLEMRDAAPATVD